MLRTLHELGTVVAHGLKDHAMLPGIHILDPNWLTKGIYTILEQGELIRRHGEFSRDQLKDWLPKDKYPPKFYDFILSMMQDKEIELCFPHRNGRKGPLSCPGGFAGRGARSQRADFPKNASASPFITICCRAGSCPASS